MSRYKAYPAYKDSEVAWLGQVPVQWELTRVKYISELTPRKPIIDKSLECSFIPMEKLKTDSLVLDESRVVADVYDGYTYFQDDDILMAKVTPCFENKNIAVAKSLVNGIGFGSSEIYVIRTNKNFCNRYWFYRFQEDSFMDVATAAMTGAGGLKRVPSDVVSNFTAALPSFNEQQKIANFLDHETAKIDTLIAKQQELIKLLKEKRQAVISHAVTKGLNPNAPMRDSGVEWLGEVPAHWVVKPLKFAISDRRGAVKAGPFGSHLKNSDMEGTDVKVITQKNVISKNFEIGDSMISKDKYRELEVFTIDRNDVLVTTRGTIGKSVVYTSNEIAILHPCLIRLQVDEKQVFPDFISLVIEESGYAIEQILVSSNSTTIEVIYSENLINTTVCLPNSLEEQGQILAEIAIQKEYFENLIQKAEQAIFLSQERRTALISAAVIGKIDVRDWQAPSEAAIAA